MSVFPSFEIRHCSSAVRQQRAPQPSSMAETSHGWTARKKGATNGEEKEAITQQCIQLELWPVH